MTLIAAASSNWIWYFGRATGFVTLILFTAIIVLGVAGRLRVVSDRWPRFVLVTVHRDLSLIALVVLGVHIVMSLLDTYVSIPLVASFVPFTSNYAPFWIGLGALCVDLVLAVVLTSLLRRHIGLPVWKAFHWCNYALWPIAVVHTIAIGTDAGGGWGLAITVACCLAVGGAVLTRLFATPVTSDLILTAPPVAARRPGLSAQRP